MRGTTDLWKQHWHRPGNKCSWWTFRKFWRTNGLPLIVSTIWSGVYGSHGSCARSDTEQNSLNLGNTVRGSEISHANRTLSTLEMWLTLVKIRQITIWRRETTTPLLSIVLLDHALTNMNGFDHAYCTATQPGPQSCTRCRDLMVKTSRRVHMWVYLHHRMAS
jgi:hypothetical protein